MDSVAADASSLAACHAMPSEPDRLKCYENLTRAEAKKPETQEPPQTSADRANEKPDKASTSPGAKDEKKGKSNRETCAGNPSILDREWASDCNDAKAVAPYKATYLLLRDTSAINNTPFNSSNEFSTPQQSANLQHDELKFQISGKTMLGSADSGRNTFWLAYTQRSYWQVFNTAGSRPFRETNYDPELIWSFRTDRQQSSNARQSGGLLNLPGTDLDLKYVNLAYLHDSNGRGDVLSRSWNRLYAEFNFEDAHQNLLSIRPWWRIPEGHSDDNPDITHFTGYGDLTYSRKLEDGWVSVLLRDNLRHDNKGAIQVDWSFKNFGGGLLSLCKAGCQVGSLSWHLQIFSGYGESLIDYNFRQTTIAIGFDLIPKD